MSSGLSDKKSTPSITEPLGGAAAIGAQVQPKVKPIHIWATVGGAILAFQLYVWIRWITGPNFERVPPGPSDPPTFMKVILVTWTAVIFVGLPVAIYYFIIRPWRRERRITLDGMLLVSLRPDVLPGSAAELLQHVVHIQHLDVQPGLVGAGRSGLGVVRETGRHDGRTAADECAGLLSASSCARCSAAG